MELYMPFEIHLILMKITTMTIALSSTGIASGEIAEILHTADLIDLLRLGLIGLSALTLILSWILYYRVLGFRAEIRTERNALNTHLRNPSPARLEGIQRKEAQLMEKESELLVIKGKLIGQYSKWSLIVFSAFLLVEVLKPWFPRRVGELRAMIQAPPLNEKSEGRYGLVEISCGMGTPVTPTLKAQHIDVREGELITVSMGGLIEKYDALIKLNQK